MLSSNKLPKQKRAQETRTRIIETAVIIFSEKGYYHTSTNEIAKISGISIGGFYAHFNNKKDLFIECIRFYMDPLYHQIYQPPAAPDLTKAELLQLIIGNTFHSHHILSGFHREVTAMCLYDDDIQQIVREIDHFCVSKTSELLKQCQHQLIVTDLNLSAFILHNIAKNTIHTSVFEQTDYSEEVIKNELTQVLSRYLFGSN